MSDVTDLLEGAREAYRRRDWTSARKGFGAAREGAALSAKDLSALADCAWWLGDLDEALPAQQEAYRRYIDAGQPRPAALMALETGYTLALRGEEAQASGWMSRALRLLEDEPESAEHGYLVYIEFEDALGASDLDTAVTRARRVQDMGHRFEDPNLVAMGVVGQGRVVVKQGRVGEGMALLDEAMVAAISDDLEPGWAGNIYCHLMLACHEIADLRRAGEWTQATARWCESMPGAGPFMGICRVHRAQLLQVQGAWDEAEREVGRVCDELAHFHVGIVAEAHYELGNLRRQRGDLTGAEAAFTTAHGLGRDPQPGMALLRLAQERAESAAASIRSALAAEERDPLARARLLPAAVEIALAAGDVDYARAASEQLDRIARTYGTAGLAASSSHARGAVLLADGGADKALQPLREALKLWQELRAPYEAARVRVLVARAYEALHDRDSATLEREAARAEFVRLGAPPDTGAGASVAKPTRKDGLTDREAQILAMVATGQTNQQIAAELVLSIRTVERHLATVYQKLGLRGRSARAAAVSYALRDGRLPVS
ncbi:MAG: LuxR C-terminal-related transcriptional regulator [Actinomycetota bacterium]